MTTKKKVPEIEEYLTIREVAAVFRVSPKTVARWADAGKLGMIRTLGGHRRITQSSVTKMLDKSMKETA